MQSPGAEDNVEDSVEAAHLLRDIDSRTPPWQHDSAWIRLPAQFIRWIVCQVLIEVCFILTQVAAAVLLWVSIKNTRYDLWLLLAVLEAFIVIAWAIYWKLTYGRA